MLQPSHSSSSLFRPLWLNIDRSLAFVDDHARATAFHVADVALQRVINGDAGAASRLAVVGGKARRLLNGAARNLTPRHFDDDVRTWYASRMKP